MRQNVSTFLFLVEKRRKNVDCIVFSREMIRTKAHINGFIISTLHFLLLAFWVMCVYVSGRHNACFSDEITQAGTSLLFTTQLKKKF